MKNGHINKKMYGKIDQINKRKNEMKLNEEDQLNQSPNKKQRAEILKRLKDNEIQENNNSLNKRISAKTSFLDHGVLEERYNLHQYYKKFNKKFELPKIEQTGKHLSSVDNSQFNRKSSPYEEDYIYQEDEQPPYETKPHKHALTKHKNLLDTSNEFDIKKQSPLDKQHMIIHSKKMRNSNSVTGLVNHKNMKLSTMYNGTPFERLNQYKPFEKLECENRNSDD